MVRLVRPDDLADTEDFHVVYLPHDDSVKLVSKSNDPLESLREQFRDCDKSINELRAGALEVALDDAGR